MKNNKIRVAIVGYGNLGKGVESQLNKNPDMELVCIFTRRDPSTLKIQSNVPIINVDDMNNWKNKIDLVFLCGGSATDLPTQGPEFASTFNTVDSFDTHAKALEYSQDMNEATKKGNTIAMTSIGWDPGLFSYMRLLIKSILPTAKIYTFWGEGVSQGHSDAIRRIKGVKDARQYTVPVEESLQKIRNGETPDLTKRQMHTRVCYVAAKEDANKNNCYLRAFSDTNARSLGTSDFNTVYKPICIDIDGINKGEDPFGYGIRVDGKILAGRRASTWLEKSIQGE